jgi:hypothetical protein
MFKVIVPVLIASVSMAEVWLSIAQPREVQAAPAARIFDFRCAGDDDP